MRRYVVDEDLAQRLRRRRECLGLSRRELAERAGVTDGMLGRYERAQSGVPPASWARLEGALRAAEQRQPAPVPDPQPQEGDLRWDVVRPDDWERAPAYQPTAQQRAAWARWERLMEVLGRGEVVRVAYSGSSLERKGLLISLARAAARHGFRVQTRYDEHTIVARRDPSRNMQDERAAHLAERRAMEQAYREAQVAVVQR